MPPNHVISIQAADVLKGFQEQRKLLLIASKAKKPDMSGLQSLLQPINDSAMSVMEIKDSNRGDALSNHLSAVADGIMVLGWVAVENRPFKHVDEFLGSAQFFGNKVLKEYKEKYGTFSTIIPSCRALLTCSCCHRDPKHIEWIQSFYAIFKDLSELVKQQFSSGIGWNPKGDLASNVAKSIGSTQGSPATTSTPPTVGAPPPPPPGPPPVLDIKTEPAPPAPSSSSGFGAVFSELNKGEAVTKGLRKVDKSEMTHKNPSLRTSSTVIDGSPTLRAKSPAPGKKPKPESMRVKKSAKKELEGNKWTVVCPQLVLLLA